MKGDKNIEDPVSKRRLRRKVLDRWENEGGRVCDELTKSPGSDPQLKRAKKALKLSAGVRSGKCGVVRKG